MIEMYFTLALFLIITNPIARGLGHVLIRKRIIIYLKLKSTRSGKSMLNAHPNTMSGWLTERPVGKALFLLNRLPGSMRRVHLELRKPTWGIPKDLRGCRYSSIREAGGLVSFAFLYSLHRLAAEISTEEMATYQVVVEPDWLVVLEGRWLL